MRILLFYLFLFINTYSFGQHSGGISIKVKIDSQVVYGPVKMFELGNESVAQFFCNKEIFFYYEISNNSKKTIKFPRPLILSIDVGDLVYHTERWIDSLKKFVPFTDKLILPAYREIKLRTLKPGEKLGLPASFDYTTQINEVNRIRFELNLNKYNKGVKNVYSDWIIIPPKQPQFPYMQGLIPDH